MQEMNGTFAVGGKQIYLVALAIKIMSAEMKEKKEIMFNSTVQYLRKKMLADLKEGNIVCVFGSGELTIALLKSKHLLGEVSILSTRDGLQMVTAYSREMKAMLDMLRPFASDYRPEAPSTEKSSRNNVVPIRKAA